MNTSIVSVSVDPKEIYLAPKRCKVGGSALRKRPGGYSFSKLSRAFAKTEREGRELSITNTERIAYYN